MSAYSAVISLEQILKQSTDHFSKDQLDSLLLDVSSLKYSIEKIFHAPKNYRYTANELGIQIRDAVYKAQDSIESFIYTKTHPTQSLREIAANMGPIIVEAEALAATIGEFKKYPDSDEENVSFRRSMSAHSVVGQEKDKELVTSQLLRDVDGREVIPITGMPGIGKTTLARSIFRDKHIDEKFPYRAWVTVSQDYNVADILGELLTQVDSRRWKGGEVVYEDTESLMVNLYQQLYNNKYLVVVDDMWDIDMWDKLRFSLPDNRNGSRVLLTIRIKDVAEAVMTSNFRHVMEPMNKVDSWALLCKITFRDEGCPTHLEKIGKKIAKNCGGLPLTIVAIGGLLSQVRKTEEYWRSIAEVTNDAPEKAMFAAGTYSDIILLSYDHLPSHLKACFLYMAAFPRDTEIHVSKLVKLWVAEGFLTPLSPPETIEWVAEEALVQLINKNLILISKYSSSGRIKTCRMHTSLLELAKKVAEKEEFFFSIRSQAENFYSSTYQMRISVHETDLMCRKQVYESTKSIKLARTLLYVDPTYPHPIPFYLTFELLRVFDAFNVFFIEFPHEIIKLIHLRYLSFTYNGKLPPSISQLKNLQILMVRREYKIIFMGVSFLPDEIWNMSQLRHLQFTESDLPLPPVVENTVLFANLQSLSNVNAYSCTKDSPKHAQLEEVRNVD